MPRETMTYILSEIAHTIPAEILTMAFRPQFFGTTIEQRIIAEIVEGPILLDCNIVGGKRREIYLNPEWELNMEATSTFGFAGTLSQAAFYKVPEEHREGRNISSVVGVTSSGLNDMGGMGLGIGLSSGGGNSVAGLGSAMLNSRTFASYTPQPQVTLEGTNIIAVSPRMFTSGLPVSVFLEYDSDFNNVNVSVIHALTELTVCATKRYIANKLRVSVDESEIVAGREIGVIKQIIEEYLESGKEYNELLMKFKGASTFDKRSLARIIRHSL